MITVSIDGRSAAFPPGVILKQAVDQLAEHPAQVLGCMTGGVVYELNDTINRSTEFRTLTYADDEGRRIYERSLRFVMLMSAKKVWPDHRVRIEHSLGSGLYVTVTGHTVTADELRQLDREMHRITRADLPITIERWSRSQAVRYYQSIGQEDTVKLLRFRPYQHLYMYTCGDRSEYFYGKMLPSTGYTRVFGLKLIKPGFVLQMPRHSAQIESIAPAAKLPKHLATFKESNEWCRILNCTQVTDLNQMILSNQLRTFIRVNEALQDKSIAHIAEQISRRHSRAIFIAGPSSSGKTTFANRLAIHLRVLGLKPLLISLDDFYRPRSEIPLQANGEYDFEHLDAINVPQFHQCVQALLNGETVSLPRYSFKQDASAAFYPPVQMTENQVLIIEGIHALNPAVNGCLDQNVISKIYISELTCLNMDDHNRIRTTDARLLRRIVRDYQFRGTHPDETLSMWPNVRAGEDKWIFPFQEQADFVFNSVLHYELPVLRNIAYDLLNMIEPENPNYLLSRRLLKILHYLVPAPKKMLDEIPPLSILREFIGGCTFYAK